MTGAGNRRRLLSRATLLLGLVAFALLSRALFLSDTLADWDPLQHALALADYDLADHTPHPPGAPVYHALVRLVALATQDPARAVLATGVILSGLAALAGYGLGLVLPAAGDRRYPFLIGLCLVAAPGLWLDSVQGGTAAGDAALAALVGLFSFRARASGRLADVVLGAVFCGLLLGFRQNVNLASLAMVPLWMSGLRRLPWSQRAAGVGVLLLVCAAWIVPSAIACGGFRQWLDPLLVHFQGANRESFLFSRSPGAVVSVASVSLFGTLRYLGLLGIPLVYAVLRALRNGDWRRSELWSFIAWWVIPLILGMLVAPYHEEEYLAVASPLLAYLSAVGLVFLSRVIGRWVAGLGGLAVIERSTVCRAWLSASVITAVAANAVLFTAASARDEAAFARREALHRIAVEFDPSATLVLTSRFEQRYLALYSPDFLSVTLDRPYKENRPLSGTLYDLGDWRSFKLAAASSDSSARAPWQGRVISDIVVTRVTDFRCTAPLRFHDHGHFGVVPVGGQSFTIRAEDGGLVAELTAKEEHP